MTTDSFAHLTRFIGRDQLGLGWLAGVSLLANDKAVTTDWHRHRTTEMIFCLRGEVNYEFKTAAPVILHAGAFLVIPSGIEHRVSDTIDSPGRRLGLNLNRQMAAKRKYAVFSHDDYARFLAKLEANAYQPMPIASSMKDTLAALDRLTRTPRLTSVECGYARILCCALLYQATLPPPSRTAPNTRLMNDAVNWLQQHLSEQVSIERLVAYMGYSKAQLFSLFKNHTGHTPNDYLQRLRIQKAKDLLARTDGTVRTIAAACGFRSAGYFARVFTRQTGLTPLGYRTKLAYAHILTR